MNGVVPLGPPKRRPLGLASSRDLALRLMGEHGLLASGWRFRFDRAKTRAGLCDEGQKCISLSENLAMNHGLSDVKDTILHEIAHALVGCRHGHGALWREKALSLGCTGHRCHSLKLALAPWRVYCPCGAVDMDRFKITRNLFVEVCPSCGGGFTFHRTTSY